MSINKLEAAEGVDLAAIDEGPSQKRLDGVPGTAVGVLAFVGIMASIIQTFPIVPLNWLPNSNSFFYSILGIFLAASFLAFPLKKSMANKAPNSVDWIFAAVSLGCSMYFAFNAVIIISQGWDMTAPLLASALGGILCLLSIEGARRAAGGPLAGVCLFFGIYPLFADHMPGIFWGNSFTLQELAAAHAMGPESIIGLPFRTVAELLFGYIVFGVALAVTGGGEFFIGLAMKLLGRTRGGTAKVSIFASALFGSLSGSPVSNVVTIGTFTIPAMKKSGYPGTFACAVEACASTGGALMPPVMGAAAFIMASFLNVPYVEVAMAAVIPSFLFYFTLFMQADCYAASTKMSGVAAEDVPSAAAVLRTGWVFAAALLVLIYVLLFLRLEIYAPWYATLVVIVGGLCDPLYRGKILQFRKFFIDNGHTLGQLVSILAGVGMVVGALAITGVGSAFARELVQYAHGNVYLLLFFGALTSFILGMGMTVSACYILLAIVLAPALIQAGLNPMASHMYIMYWGILSAITPPVAVAAIAAAAIGKADSVETGFTAMRLGCVLFIVPIFFALNPVLVGQGTVPETIEAVGSASISVIFLSCALSGYLYYVGKITAPYRIALAIGALILLYPSITTDIIGSAICLVVWCIAYFVYPRDCGKPLTMAVEGSSGGVAE
jgi:TRAP transporter 4TM/12TM fusion protein